MFHTFSNCYIAKLLCTKKEFANVLRIKYGKSIRVSNLYLFKSVPTDITEFLLTPSSVVQVLGLFMIETVFFWYRIITVNQSLI